MPQLTERCDLWRFQAQEDGTDEMALVLAAVPCLRVPISSTDKIASALSAPTTDSAPSAYMHSEGRESTDLFLLPNWLEVRPDDELHRGRYTDNSGDVVPFRYTVDGIRNYETFAYQQTICVFASLMR